MTTTILSGRSLKLTIASVDYSTQILDSAINFDTERLTFDTLAGKAYKYIDSNVTLDITFLNDAGKTTPIGSLYKALWDATESAPDTALAFVMTLIGPVIGLVKAFCLLLKVDQSVELNFPVFAAEATGRLKVCVSPLETMLKFVPLVPVVINCD